MKNYGTCFLAIHLPGKFSQEFEGILAEINKLKLDLKTAYPKTPHITIYYLAEQPIENLIEIEKIIKPYAKMLKDSQILVSGLDYFNRDKPKVVYINVLCDDKLRDFEQKMREVLAEFYPASHRGFHPHLTLARMNKKSARKNFIRNIEQIKKLAKNINWQFAIGELALYGIDPKNKEGHQEKIIIIK